MQDKKDDFEALILQNRFITLRVFQDLLVRCGMKECQIFICV